MHRCKLGNMYRWNEIRNRDVNLTCHLQFETEKPACKRNLPPMAAGRLCRRALSAFNQPNRLWTPISSSCPPSRVTQPPAGTSCLSLISQNLDAFSPRSVSRAQQLLGGILEQPKSPDIICLQEVTSDVRAFILASSGVRKGFQVTSFEGVPFANMTLLSRKRFAFDLGSQNKANVIDRGGKLIHGAVYRIQLPSKYGRCALSMDIILPSTPSTATATYRVVNVHLDSLGDAFTYRTEQMKVLADLLREPGCDGGLIVGDFNAISPDDDEGLRAAATTVSPRSKSCRHTPDRVKCASLLPLSSKD